MTPGVAAQSSLARWERGLPFEGGLPFEPLLRRCRLDYAPASLGRIDRFLDALRSAHQPDEAVFLADAAQRQLLYLLAFYSGEVIGRALGAAPLWLLPPQAAALAPRQPMPARPFHAALSARFGTAQAADGTLLFLPLAALCERLFAPDGSTPPGLQAAAAAWWPAPLRDAARAHEPLPPRPGQPWPPELPGAPVQAAPEDAAATPAALCEQALRHLRGEGVPADPARARALWQRAAALGHTRSMDYLGTAHARGLGGPADLHAALDLYRRAGDAGLLEAQLHAAQMHLRHDGPAPDLLEAGRWLRLAAAQGSEKAHELLGTLELDRPPAPTLRERIDGWTDRAVDWVVDGVERLATARSGTRGRTE